MNQYFVVDRQADTASFITDAWDSQATLGYASVMFDINGQSTFIASAPTDSGVPDPLNPGQNLPRSVTDGTAYMALCCDYVGQPGGAYVTDTLTLELSTMT